MNNKEENIVPQLRFPEFKDEWKPSTIEENCNLKGRIGYRGYTKSDLVAKGEGVLVLGGKHIQNHRLDLSDPTFLSWEKYYESPEIMVKEGHVIFSQRGSLGDCALIDKEIGEATINPSMVLIKDITSDTKFLYYVLTGNYIQNEVKRISTSAAVPMLSQKQIKDFPFFKPSLKEQQKIANCLSSLDDVITAETEKLELLQAHKKGLLQQLFPQEGETQPKYRFPEFKNDGDWEGTTLGELSKFRRGSFPQPYGLPEWYDDINGMPFIQVYDVDTNLKIKPTTKRKISQLAAEQSVFIEKGTVIITIQGSIGRVAITQYDAYIDRTLLLFEEFYKPIDKLFFAYVIQLLFEIEKEKAPGGIIKTITKEVLTSFNINIPDILEQQKIANCLSSIDETIEAQTQKIESLQNHKKGLLQQLFPNISDV
ncbi:restriction endonuclease subunit S [Aestuariibaculum suncheonense]|uniref:Restriction endonuclease subunit S n=1 Tax=Aestuariibaculum suncheonense TaxID=1028745 RepID=A0A8J6UBS6_9FLAO|nr:restriction endonuclease subunit S [Aestuariibaculum suncheonense]MBD0836533.1 restriction endonuclease subunit S [Aestuariibaculum suncheonense]